MCVTMNTTRMSCDLTSDHSQNTVICEQNYSSFPLDEEKGLMKQPLIGIILLSTGYSLVLITGIFNNSLVLSVIYRNHQMRTVINLFLGNLAVADLTVCFLVLPMTLLSNLFTDWLFGLFLCKTLAYLQAVAVGASVSTLVAVAVERYLAICKPHIKFITTNTAFVIIAFIWFIPMFLQSPWAIYSTTETFQGKYGDISVCYTKFPHKIFESIFIIGVVMLTCYLIPLLVISVFYSFVSTKVLQRNVPGIRGTRAQRNIHNAKIRILWMLIIITITFALAWLPLYAVKLYLLFRRPVGWYKKVLSRYLIPVFQLLGTSNSAINPFIYCYFSEQFRKHIVEIVRDFLCFQVYRSLRS